MNPGGYQSARLKVARESYCWRVEIQGQPNRYYTTHGSLIANLHKLMEKGQVSFRDLSGVEAALAQE